MSRIARAQRLWMGRRVALLGGSAAVAAAAILLQVTRLRLDANGAAVHGVALFVTLIIFTILLRLVRLQMSGPGLEAPSWERHVHRASLREAPLVALVGAGIALFMVVATPRLVGEDRPGRMSELAVQIPEPPAMSEPVVPVRARLTPVARGRSMMDQVELGPLRPPPQVNYISWVGMEQDPEAQERLREQEDPTRPARTELLRLEPGEPALPPVHFSIGVMAAALSGTIEVNGDSGRFQLDVDSLRGEQSFEMGADVTAEFALTPETALKLTYAGLKVFEEGHLDESRSFGSASAAAGDVYEYQMAWSHLYVGLAKRITGYTRGSWFDFSVHAGAMIDHTLSEFEVESAGVGGASEDGERGWVAAGVGFSMSLRGPGPVGFMLDLVQSVPVNIGGQAIELTDIRAGGTLDIWEGASVFLGYRYVRALYRLFEAPLERQDGETAADLLARGPIFGLEFRF